MKIKMKMNVFHKIIRLILCPQNNPAVYPAGKLLLFAICLGSTFSSKSQPHSDLQELGIKGPVKTMVIKNYYNVPASLNRDSAVLFGKDIFYLDRQGNLDSTLSYVGSGKEEDLDMDRKSIIHPGEGGNNRLEFLYIYSTGRTDTVLQRKLSDSSYQKIILDKVNGRTTTTTYYLDRDYLAYKMRAVVVNAEGDTLLTQGSEQYDKASNGFYQKVQASYSDLDNGALKQAILRHSGFDKHGNPTISTLTHLDKINELGKLEMRIYSFTYY